MSIRKVKSSPKLFISDQKAIREIVVRTLKRISEIVGSSLGPGGKNTLIEADHAGMPNKNTKDGVTIFKSLGASNAYEHLIIEQCRDSAQRTATEAGDGTTSTTILAAALVENLYSFCATNKKYSPQRAAREMAKLVRTVLIPAVQARAIKVDVDNQHLLKMVAKISANGDEDMAEAVIKAFELIGYGDSSHVTIKELSGPYGYEVSQIDGFPIPVGYEESCGKFHTAFINDQSNQRTHMENPIFLLYDGNITDIVTVSDILDKVGQAYVNGQSDYKNLVIFAHGYSDSVLTQLAFNFSNPTTINVMPMITPMMGFVNSQLHFLNDLAAFTGAKVFGMKDNVNQAELTDLGSKMTSFEAYRFRSTVVGDPDQVNIEVRADQLKTQLANSESVAEKRWLEERLGKLTSGIAKLTIYGGSNGELKEAHDRCEDAVCAVRSAITKGALPGGCRVLLDLYADLQTGDYGPVAEQVVAPSLLVPMIRLLDNAGRTKEEAKEITEKLLENPDLVYDVENDEFGNCFDLGIFDAAPAVEEALKNAASIASVMGTMGGIVAYPRDEAFERSEASADLDFERSVNSPLSFTNEANERP